MKKFLCILMCFGILHTASVLCASAMPQANIPGDVDADFEVTVKDATLIQKSLASLAELSEAAAYWADVDNDSQVTVKDATMIQKHVAGLIDSFSKEQGYTHVYRVSMYADFDSGKAMAGTPVTFTALADGYMEPFSYEFLINDEVVAERSESNTFTYTFEEKGAYYITVRVYNPLNEVNESRSLYEVVAPYESETPVVAALYYDKQFFTGNYVQYMDMADTDITVTAVAIMGSSEYEYCFMWDGEVIQDFSEDNQYVIEELTSEDYGDHVITVYVRDKGAQEYVSESLTVKCGYIEG